MNAKKSTHICSQGNVAASKPQQAPTSKKDTRKDGTSPNTDKFATILGRMLVTVYASKPTADLVTDFTKQSSQLFDLYKKTHG